MVGLLAAGGLFCAAAMAQGIQNMDIAVLVGPVAGTTQSVAGTSVKTDAGVSFSIQYAYQLHATKAGLLYFELPFAWTFRGNASVNPSSVLAVSDDATYFTPGVRFLVHLDHRIGVYGAGGIGYGSFEQYDAVVTNGVASVATHHVYHLAGGFGGGFDFRLTRFLSVRVDLRDYVSARGLGGTSGRNHGVYGFGMAFHF
jgi:hypothetical protein